MSEDEKNEEGKQFSRIMYENSKVLEYYGQKADRFINCEALLNSSLASWLRSILTTYNADHIRVTFVLDNKEQFSCIFQRYSAPLYQSTMALDLQKS